MVGLKYRIPDKIPDKLKILVIIDKEEIEGDVGCFHEELFESQEGGELLEVLGGVVFEPFQSLPDISFHYLGDFGSTESKQFSVDLWSNSEDFFVIVDRELLKNDRDEFIDEAHMLVLQDRVRQAVESDQST